MSNLKICLDAGHYGKYNQSPCDPNYYESERMWLLHKILGEELAMRGHEIYYTRTNQNKDLEVTKRGKQAKGCDLFLSLHSNAVAGGKKNETTDYPRVYCSIDADDQGLTFAKLLSKSIEYAMKTKQAGKIATKEGSNGKDYLGVLRGARSVKCPYPYLVEHSFHTNTDATEFLLNDENLVRLAVAEADCIEAFFYAKKEEDVKMVNISLPTLKNGSKNNSVISMQSLLIANGFPCGESGADGIFGKQTESSLKKYQKSCRLTSDGICGQKTWSKLLGV